MFTPTEREALRNELIEAARHDPRISGAAITGSASDSREDAWSDVDLAFGVRCADEMAATIEDFSRRMVSDFGALDHLDVPAGAWTYRVFLLPNTLQVDLAFAPAEQFGPLAPTFRLLFGDARPMLPMPDPPIGPLVGWAWLYALHARSAIARGNAWQAEYMISGMRDQVLTLACTRYGMPAQHARGVDMLPEPVKQKMEAGLVRSLDHNVLLSAFVSVTEGLIYEIRAVDTPLAERLEPALRKMTDLPVIC